VNRSRKRIKGFDLNYNLMSKYELPIVPYIYDTLGPYIDARTMESIIQNIIKTIQIISMSRKK
jgi:hypothetical protein